MQGRGLRSVLPAHEQADDAADGVLLDSYSEKCIRLGHKCLFQRLKSVLIIKPMTKEASKPDSFEAAIKQATSGGVLPIYTFVGEPPLTAPLIKELLEVLQPPPENSNFELIQPENFSESALMMTIHTPSMFGGRKVIQLNQPLFSAKKEGKEGSDSKKTKAKKTAFETWLAKPIITPNVVVILNLQTIDKRSTLFSALKEAGAMLFIGNTGGTDKEKDAFITTYIKESLIKTGKRVDGMAIPTLLDLLGNDSLVTIDNELKKLVSYVGERTTITANDVKEIVGRQREEKLYELTQFLGAKQADKALVSLNHLLEQGAHELVILNVVFNFLRRTLFIKALTQHFSDQKHLDFTWFKNQLLSGIEDTLKQHSQSLFKNNPKPYSLYMHYNAARQFPFKMLIALCADASNYDLELKGGASDKRLVLERLVLRICRGYISS